MTHYNNASMNGASSSINGDQHSGRSPQPLSSSRALHMATHHSSANGMANGGDYANDNPILAQAMGTTPKRASNSIASRRMSIVGGGRPTNASTASPRGSPGNTARRLSVAASAGQSSPLPSARGSGVHRMSVSVRSSHAVSSGAGSGVNNVNGVASPPGQTRVLSTSPQPGIRSIPAAQSSAEFVPSTGPSSHGHQLIAAVRAKQVEEIIALLAAGAEVDTHDVGGNTPLIFAAQFGFLGIVDKLVRSEAKLDLCNKEGQNALMLACARGHWQVAQALIKAGCNVDMQDGKGETALMRCAYPATPQALKSATVLIDHGHASLNLTNNEGLTALAIARQLKNELISKYLSNPQSSRAKKRTTSKGKTLRPGGNTSTDDDTNGLPSGMATPATPLESSSIMNVVGNTGNGRRSLTVDVNDNKEEKVNDTRHADIKRQSVTAVATPATAYATPAGLSVIPGISASLIPPSSNVLKTLSGGNASLQPPLSPTAHPKKPSITQQHKLHKLLGEDPELFRQTPYHLPAPPPPIPSPGGGLVSPNGAMMNGSNGHPGHVRVPSHQYSTTVYPPKSLFASLNQTPAAIAATTTSALNHSASAPAVGKRAMPLSSPHGNASLTMNGNGTMTGNDRPTTSSGRDTTGDGWDMHRILHDPACRGALLKHTEKKLCDESLLFWIAVQEHKTTLADTSSEQCFKSARDIYTRFIPDTAAQCVNISAALRRPLHALFNPSRGAQDRWLAMTPVARVALFNESEREIFRLMDTAVRQDFLQGPFFRQFIGAPMIGSVPSSPIPSPSAASSPSSYGMPFPASLSLTHPPHHHSSLSHNGTTNGIPSARGISAAQAQSAGARPAKRGNIMTGNTTQRLDTRPLLPEDQEAASLDDFARQRFRAPTLQAGSKAERLLGGGAPTMMGPNRPQPHINHNQRSITPGVLPSQSSLSVNDDDDRLRTRTPGPVGLPSSTNGQTMVSSVSVGSLHGNGTTVIGNAGRVMAGTHGTIYQSAAMPSLPGAYRVGTNPPLLPATSFAHVHSTLALRALESLAAAGNPPPTATQQQQSQQPPPTASGYRPPPLLPELATGQSSSTLSNTVSRPTSAARGGSPTRLLRQSRFKNGKGGLPGLHVET